MSMMNADEILENLKAGNRRFVEGQSVLSPTSNAESRAAVAGSQSPPAIVLGCADSRVPPEMVFDQGIGDLFVVRVAGNIATDPEIGSIEFAVQEFGSLLIVVLGHSSCGAVKATLQGIASGGGGRLSRGLTAIVDRVQSSIAPWWEEGMDASDPAIIERAVRENVHHSARRLRRGSELIDGAVESGKVKIVGAEYSLASGEVEFLGD